MIKTEKLKIKSDFDGLELGVILTAPQTEPTGILQLNHGMCEHKERYLPFMKFLSANGFICIIHDHRGHGESIRDKDDLGYFYENGDEAAVEDCHQINTYIKSIYPSLPIYLFGHSMGSLIVRVYTKKYDNDIQGLIVCGSPSKNFFALPARKILEELMPIRGEKFRSEKLEQLLLGIFNKGIENPLSPNSWICSDENVVKEYDNDELCGFCFTLNGFHSLFELMNKTYSNKGWEVKNPSMPVYFISGWEDPCRTDDKSFISAVSHMRNIGYKNIDLKLYGGARHEILNEKIKDKVYRDILVWLKLNTKKLNAAELSKNIN